MRGDQRKPTSWDRPQGREYLPIWKNMNLCPDHSSSWNKSLSWQGKSSKVYHHQGTIEYSLWLKKGNRKKSGGRTLSLNKLSLKEPRTQNLWKTEAKATQKRMSSLPPPPAPNSIKFQVKMWSYNFSESQDHWERLNLRA